MEAIDQIIERIINEEGSSYTDNPLDRGGPTKFGVTQAALSEFRGHPVTAEDVQFLLMDEAAKLYRRRYYEKPGFDKVATLSPAVSAKLTDAGVNVGTGTASKWLQRLLNVFNQGGKIYSDIQADGAIGTGTICALNAFLSHRGKDGETVLMRGLNDLQGAHYIDIAEKDDSQKTFVYGWILNRVQ